MLKVKSRTGESVQQMMRRFKKLCEKEGLIRDMKRNAYYEKPSEKNRRRERKARRNAQLNTMFSMTSSVIR
jgi:small subunit ribosomal protein S21